MNTETVNNVFACNPEDIWVYGIDTPEGFEVTPNSNFVDTDSARHTKLDKAMVESIEADGVINPVLVRMHEGRYVAVDGRRRIVHARQANINLAKAGKTTRKIVAVLETGGDDDSAREHAIIANAFAQKHSPIQEALLARNLTEQYVSKGASENDASKRAAEVFGFTAQTLKNRLKLLDLEPETQKAIDSGKIGPAAGAKLLGMEREAQLEALAKMLEYANATGSSYGAASLVNGQAPRPGTDETGGSANPDSGGGEDKPKPLSAKMIARLLATEAAANLDPVASRVLQHILGNKGAAQIKGLKACYDEVMAAEAELEHEKEMQAKARAARELRKKKEAERMAAAVAASGSAE